MDTNYSFYQSGLEVSAMVNARKAIFPGILFGVLFIICVTQFIANPHIVLASATNSNQSEPAKATNFIGEGDQNGQMPAISAVQSGECSLSAQVPESVRQWCDLIDRYSTQTGLEPKLIAALITQESAGNPNAYSHSGAVGLMQIMPRDGIATKFMCKNGPCFHDRPSMAELYDPEYNIQWGTQFLSSLLARHGNIRDALKAYGPMDRGYQYADIVLSIHSRY
jgi:soluble lytic murein transglycosylase-like protein